MKKALVITACLTALTSVHADQDHNPASVVVFQSVDNVAEPVKYSYDQQVPALDEAPVIKESPRVELADEVDVPLPSHQEEQLLEPVNTDEDSAQTEARPEVVSYTQPEEPQAQEERIPAPDFSMLATKTGRLRPEQRTLRTFIATILGYPQHVIVQSDGSVKTVGAFPDSVTVWEQQWEKAYDANNNHAQQAVLEFLTAVHAYENAKKLGSRPDLPKWYQEEQRGLRTLAANTLHLPYKLYSRLLAKLDRDHGVARFTQEFIEHYETLTLPEKEALGYLLTVLYKLYETYYEEYQLAIGEKGKAGLAKLFAK